MLIGGFFVIVVGLLFIIYLLVHLPHIINHMIIPQFLFMPPSYFSNHNNMVVSHENCWLEFSHPDKHSRSNSRSNSTAIVLFHGNASNASSMIPFAEELSKNFDCSVYIPEYPSYGAMKNNFSYLKHDQCMNVLTRFMQKEIINEYKTIILIGYSLGSHFATKLASEGYCNYLCLISPFLSVRSIAEKFVGLTISSLISEFDSEPPIKSIPSEVPLLILHGTEDEVVPFHHGKLLIEYSTSLNKSFIPLQNKGHNDVGDVILPHIISWIRKENKINKT